MGEVERAGAPGLVAIASRINEEHRACEEAAVAAVEHAIRAGELLIEAKAETPHGGWLPWLSENFEGSRTTAWTYMKLAERRDLLDVRRAEHLSIRGALRALLPPPTPPTKDEALTDLEEARVASGLSEARVAALRIAEGVSEIHRREGWAALGYASFGDWHAHEEIGVPLRAVVDEDTGALLPTFAMAESIYAHMMARVAALGSEEG